MKTTILRTAGAVFSTGILLTGCVSSKKYHRSQDEIAKLRADSLALAQQSASLQTNLNSSQQKYGDLQKNMETATSTNAGLQKNVAYYHDYAQKQTSTTEQMKTDITSSLASAGLTDQDVIVRNGKIYVNVGEKNLFKGNSATLTPKGRQLVDNLGQFVKSHEAVDVSIADLQLATSVDENGNPSATTGNDNNGSAMIGTSSNGNGNTGTNGNGNNGSTGSNSSNDQGNMSAGNNSGSGNGSAMNSSSARTSSRHTSGRRSTGSTTTGNNDANTDAATTSTTDKTAHKSVAVHHHRSTQSSGSTTTATSGESRSVAYSSGRHNKYTAERHSRSAARAIAWQRQTAVADALLKTGIPKVKVVEHNPSATANESAPKGVQVVLVNNIDEFYKHMSEAPAMGQPVSANP